MKQQRLRVAYSQRRFEGGTRSLPHPPPTPPQKTQATTPEGGTANPPTPARLSLARDAYLQANILFKIKGTSINNF